MIGQLFDIETFELQLERKLERYQRKYGIDNAHVAWMLLRIGTKYYFKDICSRGNGNGNGNGRRGNGHGNTG